jgi:hypothetical protein
MSGYDAQEALRRAIKDDDATIGGLRAELDDLARARNYRKLQSTAEKLRNIANVAEKHAAELDKLMTEALKQRR